LIFFLIWAAVSFIKIDDSAFEADILDWAPWRAGKNLAWTRAGFG
jgi:hypothetical protein